MFCVNIQSINLHISKNPFVYFDSSKRLGGGNEFGRNGMGFFSGTCEVDKNFTQPLKKIVCSPMKLELEEYKNTPG